MSLDHAARLGQGMADRLFNRPKVGSGFPHDPEVAAAAKRCRKLVSQRALLAAGVTAVPIPGLDVIADVALLTKVFERINAEFNLTPAEIEKLRPDQRLAAYKAISLVGNQLIGKLVTQTLILQVLKTVGLKVATKQVSKYVPIAGQVVSAALTFAAIRHVCHQHIADCIAVRRHLLLIAR